ncbi:hypothetical protein [Vibrio cholerae]|uniref:hypothetical protein n=1 Tax=Vibrio cholerae TaxID=666 RepID=UPI003A0FF933
MVGDDNTVNKAEADDKASVTLSGTVSGDAKVGDTITLTLGDKSTLTTQAVDFARGKRPDTQLRLVGDDNTVNKAEADDKASVTLSGTVSGDAKVGDTITLTLGDKSTLTTQVVRPDRGGRRQHRQQSGSG